MSPIATMLGKPIHPHIEHINSLPQWPGFERVWWNIYTKDQLLKILYGMGVPSTNAPRKTEMVVIALPGDEAVRITRLQKGGMYAIEGLRKNPTPGASTPSP